MSLANIRHIVVLMLENRSLDNLLGWLYAGTGNPPKINIPPFPEGRKPIYYGLTEFLSGECILWSARARFCRGPRAERRGPRMSDVPLNDLQRHLLPLIIHNLSEGKLDIHSAENHATVQQILVECRTEKEFHAWVKRVFGVRG